MTDVVPDERSANQPAESWTRWHRVGIAAERRRWVRYTIAGVPVVLLVAAWSLVAAVRDRPRIFPSPQLVAVDLFNLLANQGEVGAPYQHVLATMSRLAVAFVFAMIVGITLGVLAGRIPFFFNLFKNLVWIFMAVPSIVWVFIFAVALGITNLVPIAAVAALLTPMALIHIAEGMRSLDHETLVMADSYKATTQQRVVDVYLPYLTPYIVSTARVTFALGMKLVIVAEVIGLASGIGFELRFWFDSLFMGPIVAWAIVMIILGLVVDHGLFGPVERRANRWKGDVGKQAGVRSIV